jgi:YD repeat-containing protein
MLDVTAASLHGSQTSSVTCSIVCGYGPMVLSDEHYETFIVRDSSSNYDAWVFNTAKNTAKEVSLDAGGSPTNHDQAFVMPNSDARYIVFEDSGHIWLRYDPNPSVPFGQLLGGSKALLHALSPCDCFGDPVNTATGDFYTSVTDASLPGIAVPFTFTRSYNSLNTTSGPMGLGWTFSYDVHLSTAWNGDVTLHAEDGQLVHFSDVSGTYVGDQGVRDLLVKNGGGTYTLTRHDRITYQFDSAGRVTSIENLDGEGLTFSYTSGALTGITDSSGRSITLGYTSGLLTSLSFPGGSGTRSVAYHYTGGLLTSVTDVRGNTITYGYDGSNRLNSIADQDWVSGQTHRTNLVYGSNGRVASLKDGRNHSATFSWDPVTQTATSTDNRGRSWTDVYNDGAVLSKSNPVSGETTSQTFDADLNTASKTDAGNNAGSGVTSYTYDTAGNLLQENFPSSLGYNSESWTYNALKEPLSFTDGRSPQRTTYYEYDANGHLTCVLDADAPSGVTSCSDPGATQQYKANFTYDPTTGQLASRTDQNGNTWQYSYTDTWKNLTEILGPATAAAPSGSETTMAYDSGGRMTSRIEPRGYDPGPTSDYTWTYAYDDADHLLSSTDPLDVGDAGHHTVTNTYDPVGNLTSVTSQASQPVTSGEVTRYEYDGDNNLVCVLSPLAPVANSSYTTCAASPQTYQTNYTYDAGNNMLSRKDGKGHVWSYAYDDDGRLSSVTSQVGRVWGYSYWPDGQLETKTLPDSSTIDYSYDQLDRPTGINYSSSGTPDVTFSYDANGNRTQMTDGAGTMDYAYDDLNRLCWSLRGTSSNACSSTPSGAFGYTYTPTGELKTESYPDGTAVTDSYYGDNTLCWVLQGTSSNACSSPPSGSTTYGYDSAGNMTSRVLPNSVTATMAYDRAGRLTSVSNKKGTTTQSSFALTLDGVGNSTQDAASSGTINYSYDAQNRLLSACYSSCTGGSRDGYEYAYDADGNIQTLTRRTTPSDVTTSYWYNADDQLCWVYVGTSTNPCSSRPAGSTAYTFSSNGNETGAGSTTMAYDQENRLTSWSQGGTTETYTYDGDGNRLTRAVGGTTQNKYVWDTQPTAPGARDRAGRFGVARPPLHLRLQPDAAVDDEHLGDVRLLDGQPRQRHRRHRLVWINCRDLRLRPVRERSRDRPVDSGEPDEVHGAVRRLRQYEPVQPASASLRSIHAAAATE